MNFKNTAIQAAKQYYQYLDERNGSLIIYQIESKRQENRYFYFKLKTKLRSLDMLQIKINTTVYNDEQIKILEYDKENNCLKISANNYCFNLLKYADFKEIQVVVDLKFLVKNVEKFYVKYGDALSLPEKANGLTYNNTNTRGQIPSEEQINAVNVALQSPLSYIWGAPGTGKTRFVLSQCILSYLKNNEDTKLIITSPTNNAVEQTLLGVLPILRENNIDLKKVLRLGTPSSSFAAVYPECCEYKSAERQADEIRKKINSIDNRIAQTQNNLSLLYEYQGYIAYETNLNNCKITCKNLTGQMKDIVDETEQLKTKVRLDERIIRETEEKIKVCNGQILFLSREINKTTADNKALSNTIDSLTNKIQKYSNGIRKKIFKKKKEKLSEQLKSNLTLYQNNQSKLSDSEKEKKKVTADIDVHKAKLTEHRDAIQTALQDISKNETKFEELKKQFVNASRDYANLYKIAIRITLDNFENIKISFFDKFKIIEEQVALEKKQLNVEEIPPEEVLYKLLDELEEAKEILLAESETVLSRSTSMRMKECSVIAATVDTCIARIVPNGDFIPSHIFLDEAGYCPLIKAVTLFAHNVPITLLGDHMQLPPICEMNSDLFYGDNTSVVLFSLSAIYAERFEEPLKVLLELYFNSEREIEFTYTAYAELNHSFRFGSSLAKVLAKNVYSEKFEGSDLCPTKIYYIHAPKVENPKIRISSKETELIVKFLNNNYFDSVGILSPYKDQIKNLKAKLPDYDVVTVHQSQGREWETVLFSVVDTTNKWFTHSFLKQSGGLNVINTAVSRAKKKLIIVCDYDYWKYQDKQLITQILKSAEEIII